MVDASLWFVVMNACLHSLSILALTTNPEVITPEPVLTWRHELVQAQPVDLCMYTHMI